MFLAAICVAFISFVGSARPGDADAAWVGSTGLIFVPTADVAADGAADVQAHWVNRPNDVKLYGGTFGIGYGLEVATSVVDPSGPGTDTLAHIKYSHTFTEGQVETAAGMGAYEQAALGSTAIRAAAGIFDLSDELDRSVYVVASRLFQMPQEVAAKHALRSVDVSVGYGNSEAGAILDGFFAGARLQFPYNISALVEYDTEDLNFGVRYQMGGLGLDVASLDGDLGYGAVFSTGF